MAGNVLAASAGAEELDDAPARVLNELMASGRFEELARASPLRGAGADMYQYELTVERAGDRARLICDEDRMPSELWPLIEALERHEM